MEPPLEDPPESPEALRARGRQALAGAVALVAGIGLLTYRLVWPGIILLSLGCLGLGWSIGGYGGGGYGGSDS